jgi:SAM-dependent methyltransferase
MQTTAECYSVGVLPVWRGAQTGPALQVAPFAFERNKFGVIRLKQSNVLEEVVEAYGHDDYHFITSPPGSSDWGNRLAQKSLDGVNALCGSIAGLDVLELGGGTLYSAQYMVGAMGAASVTVVDPAIAVQPDDRRIRVCRVYFQEDTPVERRYKLIVSFNALEHIPDPLAFLRAAHRNLADDGMIYLKMPECEDSFRMGDLGLCVHEHLSYFTRDSLETLLRCAGFALAGDASYRGALQITARKGKPIADSVCASTSGLLARFGERAEAHVERLRAFAHRHRGESVAFVGASVGLSNALYLSEIAKDMDVEIYDGDSLKTGRYLPGFDKPIRLTGDKSLEKHTQVFITPVNFFDEIEATLRRRPGLGRANLQPVFAQ